MSLIELVVSLQKKAFIKALSISEDVLKYKRTLTQVIRSAGDRLRAKFQERIKERRRVLDFSDRLEDVAFNAFSNLSDGLNEELKPITDNYFAVAERSDHTHGCPEFKACFVRIVGLSGHTQSKL